MFNLDLPTSNLEVTIWKKLIRVEVHVSMLYEEKGSKTKQGQSSLKENQSTCPSWIYIIGSMRSVYLTCVQRSQDKDEMTSSFRGEVFRSNEIDLMRWTAEGWDRWGQKGRVRWWGPRSLQLRHLRVSPECLTWPAWEIALWRRWMRMWQEQSSKNNPLWSVHLQLRWGWRMELLKNVTTDRKWKFPDETCQGQS